MHGDKAGSRVVLEQVLIVRGLQQVGERPRLSHSTIRVVLDLWARWCGWLDGGGPSAWRHHSGNHMLIIQPRVLVKYGVEHVVRRPQQWLGLQGVHISGPQLQRGPGGAAGGTITPQREHNALAVRRPGDVVEPVALGDACDPALLLWRQGHHEVIGDVSNADAYCVPHPAPAPCLRVYPQPRQLQLRPGKLGYRRIRRRPI